jgi:hypothetical protein
MFSHGPHATRLGYRIDLNHTSDEAHMSREIIPARHAASSPNCAYMHVPEGTCSTVQNNTLELNCSGNVTVEYDLPWKSTVEIVNEYLYETCNAVLHYNTRHTGLRVAC